MAELNASNSRSVASSLTSSSSSSIHSSSSSPPSTTSSHHRGGGGKKQLTWQYLVSGSIAGMTAKTLLQPLDLVKIRLQVQDGAVKDREYRGITDAITKIVRKEGFFGLYRGLQANLLGSALSWGTYFFTYNQLKYQWRKNFLSAEEKQLGPLAHLACAGIGSTCAMIVTNPVTMVKTRLQLQGRESASILENQRQYKGVYDAFRTIVKEEGLLAFYRGLAPSLLLVSNGALQFMAYEELKIMMTKFYGLSSTDLLDTQHSFWMGGTAKLFSATITYPFQLSRSRLYQKIETRIDPSTLPAGYNGSLIKVEPKYNGMSDVFRQIIEKEGFFGFYRGLSAHLLKTAPSSAVTLFVYESVTRLFNKYYDHQHHQNKEIQR